MKQKMDKVIEQIVQRRIALGISQTELARRANMKQPAIARLERGESSPQLDTLRPILNALGCDISIVPLD